MKFLQFTACLPLCISVLAGLTALPQTSAQTADSTVQLKTADFTGKHPRTAMMAAISASREDVVVVLVKGGGEALAREVEGQMKALVHNGYERIGLVIGRQLPDEQSPVVSIFSAGTIYAAVPDANADAETSWKIYSLVRDAYQENIWPKMKGKGTSSNKPD